MNMVCKHTCFVPLSALLSPDLYCQGSGIELSLMVGVAEETLNYHKYYKMNRSFTFKYVKYDKYHPAKP